MVAANALALSCRHSFAMLLHGVNIQNGKKISCVASTSLRAPPNSPAYFFPQPFLRFTFLPFIAFSPTARNQKQVVKLPSLNSPERMRRRWEVLGEFAKYAFCGLKRKRRDFERSVLKYVSIKIPALTHSGRKSRVCVNQPDRLLPHPTLPYSCLLPFS